MMMNRWAAVLLGAVVCAGLKPTTASAQGRGVQFLNFEAPAHKPIAVVPVGGTHYLLVANGPDNSVEVYDTANHTFMFRVPTGQRPVTLAVRPSLTPAGGRQIYVANWLGDSVTVFDLESGIAGLTYRLRGTHYVGDEPVGITFMPENSFDPLTQPQGALYEAVFVTLSSRSNYGVFRRETMVPYAAAFELMQATTSTSVNFAVQDPRAIAFAPPPLTDGPYTNEMWVLNFRGGNDPSIYDLDLWGTNNIVQSAVTGFSNLPSHGGLGTTNFNMAFAANGDLFVVGINARNKDPALGDNLATAVGEPIHQAMAVGETGFAVSFLGRYRGLTSGAAQLDLLDLNDASQGMSQPPMQSKVPVTQPTDVVVHGDGGPGTRLFITGMSSDTIAVVEPSNQGPATWKVQRLKMDTNGFSASNLDGVMRGPRGLALKHEGLPAAEQRLYIYNRLDQTVSWLDPNAPAPLIQGNFSLQFIVEPAHVRVGRKFIYSSALSKSGNVSCATCHIDGNTDFLAWNLADNSPIPDPSDPNALLDALGPNAALKMQMVTQPLRGLVNFEVAGDLVQDGFFSNRPYHWRGDKGFLEHFNAAFVNLMGMTNINLSAPTPAHHKGIPDAKMRMLREYVFSMHYPPNPDQPWRRQYSGTMIDPDNPPQNEFQELVQINTAPIGSGGQLGLKSFHLTSGNCVACHALPEGSNNLFTEATGDIGAPGFPLNALETAQLKGLAVKEKRLIRVNGQNQLVKLPVGGANAITHEFGLTSTGQTNHADGMGNFVPVGSESIDAFVDVFEIPDPNIELGVNLYVREFDSGTGPLVGFSSTINPAHYAADATGLDKALLDREAQVDQANCGLAVHVSFNGTLHGLYYDVTDRQTPYHEIPQPGVSPIGPLSRGGLLKFLSQPLPNTFISFHFTPLGSARRVANLAGGKATQKIGPGPSNVQMLPMTPMSANEDVPKIILNFAGIITSTNAIAAENEGGKKLFAQAHYMKSLLNWGNAGYGLPYLRHEPPRRFRVMGDDIRDGALLVLRMPTAAGTSSTTPPAAVPSFGATIYMILPLYPAHVSGVEVWETAAELEPLFVFMLLNGGPFNPPVTEAYFTPYSDNLFTGDPPEYVVDQTDLMQPDHWNWHYVQVANRTPTGFQLSPGSWQRLSIDG